MTSRRPASPKLAPVVRVIATILAGLVVLFVMNTARSDSQNAAGTQVSTSSLLTVPGAQPDVSVTVPTSSPIQFPTTAPILLPTATSLPTSTAVPTSAPTVAPTAAPTAAPTSEPEPEAQTTTSSAAVAGQSGVAPTEVVPNPVIPTSTSVPNPVAPTEVAPNPTIPTATAVPNPVAPTQVVPNPTIPTATAVPNPVPRSDVQVAPTPTVQPPATATPVPVQTIAQLEAFVLGEINDVRARAGLSPLSLDPGISATSRDWSRQMAVGGFFRHRPGSELNVLLPSGWREWGENIASAPDIFWAQSSLESSPGHYANMVGNFTHVGIGVYSTGNQVWLTQNFVRY